MRPTITRTRIGARSARPLPPAGRPGRMLLQAAAALCVCLGLASLGRAATCQVPSTSHPTIQSAVDDAACTEIVVAAGTFAESVSVERDLTLRGAGSGSTVVDGLVEVRGAAVEIRELAVLSDPGATAQTVWAHTGAEVTCFDVVAVNGAESPLFADGFETGDTSRWSASIP